MKKLAYALTCTDKEGNIISVDLFPTMEAARNEMYKSLGKEQENALCGAFKSGWSEGIGYLNAYIEYPSTKRYWSVNLVPFNPEEYK